MKTNNDAFNTKWWDEFLAKNKNFTEPCVMKDCLDQSYIDLLNNGIVEMLQERYKVQHVDRGFRVYVEGVEQNSDFCKKAHLLFAHSHKSRLLLWQFYRFSQYCQ